jgi:uncharacterized protein YukE
MFKHKHKHETTITLGPVDAGTDRIGVVWVGAEKITFEETSEIFKAAMSELAKQRASEYFMIGQAYGL